MSIVRLALAAFLACLVAPSVNAQASEAIEGHWVVVPRMAPETISPGVVPRVFSFEQKHGKLSGTFLWYAQPYPLSDFVASGDALQLKITIERLGKTTVRPMYAKVSADKRFIDVWLKEMPVGAPPFTARKVSQTALAAILQSSPQPDNLQKLPLPPRRLVPQVGSAPTPPMGWNSWNHFREAVTDKDIREMADALVSSGLRDAGYVYVSIDDGWQSKRDANGVLQPNSNFPDMKALADHVHSKGLKLGIYSSPGPLTCAGYLGSHGHEEQDAKTFAEWGVDLLKYDWCGARTIYESKADMQALYQKMGEALRATGRPIVYSLCQYGAYDVSSWGRDVGGSMWRTGGDTIEGDLWSAIDHRFDDNGTAEHAGPGGWNDADMMLVGIPGLSEEEWRTHFTLWAISASPIILGNDLRNMSPAVKSILANRAVIAVNQDPLGRQATRGLKDGDAEIWTKPLADGSMAVALFNRGKEPRMVSAAWSKLGLAGRRRVVDLWRGADLGSREDYAVEVPRHGSVLLKVSPRP